MSTHWNETTPLAQRRSLVAALAVAGIVAPILFTAVIVAQTLFRPEHSLVSLPSSALATGQHAWVQDVNFIVAGVLLAALAVGLHLGVRHSRGSLIGPRLLMLSGLRLAAAGVFPAKDATGAFSQDQMGHFVAAAFIGGGLGLIVLSRRLTSDTRWRDLGAYVLVTGFAMPLLFLAFGGLARSPAPRSIRGWASCSGRL